MNTLLELQNWYLSNCDGEWEEECGIKIETLANPGWRLEIDLFETNLEGFPFTTVNIENSDEDWFHCRVTNNRFEASGDPSKLETLIRTFLNWAKSQKADWLTPPPPLTPEQLQAQEDRKFYELLDDEVPNEPCQQAGCRNNRIRYGVMCRRHHFEMVKKRPPPETEQ